MFKETQEKVLIFHPDKCTGCTYCMTACSYKHFGLSSFEKSFIKIIENPEKPFTFIAAHCAHCDDPPCKASCPTDAIYKDDYGIVRINYSLCIGCKYCQIACPISHPYFDEEQETMMKCDLCDGNPICVQQCPTKALEFIDRVKAREEVTIKIGSF